MKFKTSLVTSAAAKFFFAAILGSGFLSVSAHAAESPRFFSAKPGSLAKARERLAAGDKDLAKALRNLVSDADEALKEKPPTVTAKSKLPPSGDKHDYVSLAPYFWPDPKKKGGLPYIRHDGKVNPESRDERANDGPRIKLIGNAIETLALAYHFTGKETYAAHAAKFARAWFLDAATRMNPHFKFAQAVLGKNDGRGTGILEACHIAGAADALGLLAGSASWTSADQRALDVWLNTFLDWMLMSEAGHDERDARNNHGTFFAVQSARLALCVGRREVARQIIEGGKARIGWQIERDGRQPLELERTTSFSYSRFNLEALCELATLGEHAGVDLWHFQTADGRSIRRGLDFMLPYVDQPAKKWPYQQIKEKHDQSDFLPLLRQAALAYDAPAYEAIIAKYSDARSKRFQLLFIK